MRLGRTNLTLLTVLVGATLAGPAVAQSRYDGLWRVTVVTKTGSCDASKTASVTVTDGVIQGDGDISGKVNKDGLVRASLGQVYAQGHLDGNAGSGKWSASSSGVPCSGSWVASRQ